jgi:uncharacterized Tic20 family protein
MGMLTEIIGWIATVIILVSFLFSGKKLRIINFIGAFTWVFWGIMMQTWNVIILNILIMVIHSYKIYKMRKDVLA